MALNEHYNSQRHYIMNHGGTTAVMVALWLYRIHIEQSIRVGWHCTTEVMAPVLTHVKHVYM